MDKKGSARTDRSVRGVMKVGRLALATESVFYMTRTGNEQRRERRVPAATGRTPG
jgi:hypothetical protein